MISALLTAGPLQTVTLGAAVLGLLAGALGPFALLRKQSLMGDVLSHAALPGICAGFLFAGTRDLGFLMAGALASGALAALMVQVILRATRIKADAAMGIILSTFFALGVVLLSSIQTQGGAAQAGLSSFLFGQAAAMLQTDVWLMASLAGLSLAVVALFWPQFKLATFDPEYARSLGAPLWLIEAALTLIIACAIVVGLQMVGVVLMVAMLIAPAAAARQWVQSLGAMVILSALFGMAAGVIGALISATARGLATGPVVVLIATAIVAFSLIFAPDRGLIAHLRRGRA